MIIALGILTGLLALASAWELFSLVHIQRLPAALDGEKQEIDLMKVVEQWERKKPFTFTAPKAEKKEATPSAEEEAPR